MCNSYETYVITKDADTNTQEVWRNPAADIVESKDKFSVYVTMPGVTKENISVKIENDELIITGRKDEPEQNDRKYVLREIRRGNYVRKFKVTNLIDKEGIQANYENGVLTLELMKKADAQPKSITIN